MIDELDNAFNSRVDTQEETYQFAIVGDRRTA